MRWLILLIPLLSGCGWKYAPPPGHYQAPQYPQYQYQPIILPAPSSPQQGGFNAYPAMQMETFTPYPKRETECRVYGKDLVVSTIKCRQR